MAAPRRTPASTRCAHNPGSEGHLRKTPREGIGLTGDGEPCDGERRDSRGSGRAGSVDGPDSGDLVQYRWTCPFCGERGTGLATPEKGRLYAVNNLTSHVRTTDDEAHGAAREVPPTLDDELDDYVDVSDE